MGFTVVNTIHLPGVDFGGSLLAPMDAQIVSAMGRTEEELIGCTGHADGVVCSGPVQPWSGRVIRALENCRIIASLGIGYDRIDLGAANEKCIVVTNVPDYCIDEVSTHAISLMLALNRRLLLMDRTVRRSAINFVPPNRQSIQQVIRPVYRLQDLVLGIVGLGRIGTATALKARGLGMQVIAHDPYVWDAVMRSHGVTPAAMDTLLTTADMISIHCSLTEETRGMIDEAAISKMKPSACLINTARGEVIDEASLIAALNDGRISGAGLDVTCRDPLPQDDPLKTAPNTILTGHGAWYSTRSDAPDEFWQKAMAQVALALQGRWPTYPVNPEIKAQWIEKWGLKTGSL
ncbi:MAG: C-terminal binding protein [Desulfosarcina sp.]|jgi:D-3-phosphoglycerate dehydrogenase